jgi:diaminohydroxyphosphoribosylaminopyrimidine deaminase/5-amino-6-(5-phosphoribosylamino)uracil reductase
VNGKIAAVGSERLLISNEHTNRVVHKWRSEEQSILIGTNTALLDNPSLTNRLWTGKNPIRLVIDMDLKLPSSAKLMNGEAPTIVFNRHQHTVELGKDAFLQLPAVSYYQVTEDVDVVMQVLNACYQLQLQSVLVEGGAQLLQSFIKADCWDEAYVITNEVLTVAEGLGAPVLTNARSRQTEQLEQDRIDYFVHSKLEYSGV